MEKCYCGGVNRSITRIRLSPQIFVIGWYIIAVITWGCLLVSLPGYYLVYIQQPVQQQFDSSQLIFTVSTGLASLVCAVLSLSLATFLFLRKPGDRAARFVSFFLLIYGLIMAGPFENGEYLFTHQTGLYAYRVQAVIFIPMMIILLLIFPNGTITPARFRWLIPFLFPIMLIMLVLPYNEIVSLPTLRSKLVYGFTIILFLCGFGAQVYRYLRKASLIERQQMKIVVYGIALQSLLIAISGAIFLQMPAASQGYLLPETLSSHLLWWISIAILPISLTLAVVRSRLWDIDVVIRRTLIYGLLTAALALLYFVSVILIQSSFKLFGGHESPVAIVVSTLVIAGLFNPLRLRIQAAIDRRFYRSKYDSRQALARFEKSMRERVDLDQVQKELADIVQVTVQPEWIAVWMRKPTKE
jgi:hypothetical protein